MISAADRDSGMSEAGGRIRQVQPVCFDNRLEYFGGECVPILLAESNGGFAGIITVDERLVGQRLIAVVAAFDRP